MKGYCGWILLLFCHLVSAGDDNPVFLSALQNQILVGEGEDWTPPDYSNQENRMGYIKQDFTVGRQLERKTGFWIDIYSKYDSNKGVIHDAQEIDLVYEVLTFPALIGEAAEIRQIRKTRERM